MVDQERSPTAIGSGDAAYRTVGTPRSIERSLYVILSILSFMIPAVSMANHVLNHFYVTGGYMLDSGFYAHLSAYSLTWPPNNPPAIGGTFFSTHFSPILYVLSAVYKVLSACGIVLPARVYFSLIQGIWFGTTSLAVFLLLAGSELAAPQDLALAALASVVSAFSGPSLAALSFPHIEIGIVAFLMLFFALYFNQHKFLAYVTLTLGLLMREDAGLHFFGFLITLAAAVYLSSKSTASQKRAKEVAIIGVLCLLYSVIVIVIQKALFSGDNALARVYLGSPAFHHLNWTFVHDRIYFIFSNRMYIIIPLLILLGLSLLMQDLMLLAGVLAVIPWLIFSFVAISFQAGALTFYYAFPVIVSLLWPAVSYRSRRAMRMPSVPSGVYASFVLLLAISSLAYARTIGPNDGRSSPGFNFDWYGKIANNQSALSRFLSGNRKNLNIVVDDSLATLNTETVTDNEWRYGLAFSMPDLMKVDVVIFQPDSWLAPRAKDIISKVGLSYICKIKNSSYFAASKYVDLEQCDPETFAAHREISTTSDTLNAYPGWSQSEPGGRWTVGDLVILPPFMNTNGGNMTLCLKGHGFLPLETSKIVATVFIRADQPVGSLVFTDKDNAGERCLNVPDAAGGTDVIVHPELRISGYSSPLQHGLSSDERLLGIFLERITVRFE